MAELQRMRGQRDTITAAGFSMASGDGVSKALAQIDQMLEGPNQETKPRKKQQGSGWAKVYATRRG